MHIATGGNIPAAASAFKSKSKRYSVSDRHDTGGSLGPASYNIVSVKHKSFLLNSCNRWVS
jgi:hypothetical protein